MRTLIIEYPVTNKLENVFKIMSPLDANKLINNNRGYNWMDQY